MEHYCKLLQLLKPLLHTPSVRSLTCNIADTQRTRLHFVSDIQAYMKDWKTNSRVQYGYLTKNNSKNTNIEARSGGLLKLKYTAGNKLRITQFLLQTNTFWHAVIQSV